MINKNLFIAPNPAESYIDINYYDENNLERIIISDYQGRIIYCNKIMGRDIEGETFRIDISNLPKGFYCVSVIADGGICTKKFLKN